MPFEAYAQDGVGSQTSERQRSNREKKKLFIYFHFISFVLIFFSRSGAWVFGGCVRCWEWVVHNEMCNCTFFSFSFCHLNQFPPTLFCHNSMLVCVCVLFISSDKNFIYSEIRNSNVFIVFNSIKIRIIWFNEINKWLWGLMIMMTTASAPQNIASKRPHDSRNNKNE